MHGPEFKNERCGPNLRFLLLNSVISNITWQTQFLVAWYLAEVQSFASFFAVWRLAAAFPAACFFVVASSLACFSVSAFVAASCFVTAFADAGWSAVTFSANCCSVMAFTAAYILLCGGLGSPSRLCFGQTRSFHWRRKCLLDLPAFCVFCKDDVLRWLHHRFSDQQCASCWDSQIFYCFLFSSSHVQFL